MTNLSTIPRHRTRPPQKAVPEELRHSIRAITVGLATIAQNKLLCIFLLPSSFFTSSSAICHLQVAHTDSGYDMPQGKGWPIGIIILISHQNSRTCMRAPWQTRWKAMGAANAEM
eukprot:1159396-Pelagomonas_calceolata.AAC.7